MAETLALIALLLVAALGGAMRPNLIIPAIFIIGAGAVAGSVLAGVVAYFILLGIAILQYGADDVVAI